MTAEEKLKELYKAEKEFDPRTYKLQSIDKEKEINPMIHVTPAGKVGLSPEDIDLIANLVVERLKKEDK